MGLLNEQDPLQTQPTTQQSTTPQTAAAPSTGGVGPLPTPSTGGPGPVTPPTMSAQTGLDSPLGTSLSQSTPGQTPTDYMLSNPNVRNIDQEKETVQGQLRGILKSDSPLMKLAERQGLEQASKRGLLNSSLAAESAQVGMMREARPIAESDAQAYQRQALQNQQAENQFLGRAQEAGLQNWLSATGDDRKKEMMLMEFEQDRKMLEDEYGFQAEETAGKQNAALWAQFIQGASEINAADMKLKDKKAQIATLKQMTLDGMANNALYFKNPEMYDWLVDQMNNVDTAVNNAVNPLEPGTNPLAPPVTTQPGETTTTYDIWGNPIEIQNPRYGSQEWLAAQG